MIDLVVVGVTIISGNNDGRLHCPCSDDLRSIIGDILDISDKYLSGVQCKILHRFTGYV